MSGRILIADDVATNRIVLKVKLEAAFYTALLAATGEQALVIARDERPDLILLDLMLPDMSGVQVMAQLRADPITAGIPVIIMSSTHDATARLSALSAGADEFLTKPVPDAVLLARLRNLLRAHSEDGHYGFANEAMTLHGLAEHTINYVDPARISLISDRAEQTMRWRRELPLVFPGSYIVQTLETALSNDPANSAAESNAPDIYLVDSGFAGGEGVLHIISDLRSRGASRHAAICLLGTALSPEKMAMAFDIGANDVIDAQARPAEIGLRLQTLATRKRSADRARASVNDGLRMAMIDPLTGLFNRRYALPHLTRIAEAARQDGSTFAVMVIDFDRFKLVNDRYGHAAGDTVLAEISHRLAGHLRGEDLIARIGGEELLVVLPGTSHTQARTAAERLCNVVKDQPVRLDDGTEISMTISIGLAFNSTAYSVAELIDKADQALMHSKSAGRNRVTISLSAA